MTLDTTVQSEIELRWENKSHKTNLPSAKSAFFLCFASIQHCVWALCVPIWIVNIFQLWYMEHYIVEIIVQRIELSLSMRGAGERTRRSISNHPTFSTEAEEHCFVLLGIPIYVYELKTADEQFLWNRHKIRSKYCSRIETPCLWNMNAYICI